MRMWMVDPRVLCKQHLLGEHFECGHMLPSSILHGHIRCLEGLAREGYIEVQRIRERHEELAQELKNRGYKHNSPLVEFSLDSLPVAVRETIVDPNRSLRELENRCERCKARIAQHRSF